MIGGTREESAFFLADDDAVWNGTLTEEELRERVAAVAGRRDRRSARRLSPRMPQASPGDRLIAALTGSNFWIRTVLLAERYAARRRAPVYMYSLDWQSPAHGGRLKAHHAMDLPFVFDNTDVADTTAGAPGAARTGGANVGDLDRLRPQRQPGQSRDPGLAGLHDRADARR